MKKVIETDILVVGAGPVGLFTVFEAGLLGLHCEIIDNLDKPGGQCSELYPEKPIYDIPGVAIQTAEEHVNALLEQIRPFDYNLHLNQRVNSIKKVDDDSWELITSEDSLFRTKNIFIAAGGGSFEPRRPPSVKDPDKFLSKGIEYSVKERDKYQDKDLLIFGGGDSALDWSVELAEVCRSITLIHRRDAFRGAPNTEKKMRDLVHLGKINLKTPFVIESIIGNKKATGALIKNFATKEIEEISSDEILFLFGLNKKLGPILNWNLDLKDNKIKVDTEKFETSESGIFAVGDINDYPGKLDLILCGFHETTLAVQHAYKRLNPGEKVPFGYTTSNTKLQKKLGVS
tara:strand:+ start:1874 stop:2908 length:1035 start_codon:yes stop_codon:yes gene_type:complete